MELPHKTDEGDDCMNAIGMLGGMGPESTSYTYMRMVRYCQERYRASLDSDFPPILIYSMPVPDVVDEGNDVLNLLDDGLARLKAAGASFSFIACNTMQVFVPSLRNKYDMLSLVEETVREANSKKYWGILATSTTVAGGAYQAALLSAGLEPIIPSALDQSQVTIAIREILRGRDFPSAKYTLLRVISSLADQGAEGVILGCTDLPIVVSQDDTRMKVLDTADIIAKAAVEKWRGLKIEQEKNTP